MNVREVRPGLWVWEQPHPEWTPENGAEGWGRVVSSFAVHADGGHVLVDPLAPPAGTPDAERFWRALDRDVGRRGPPAVLLTIYYHARSSQEILERYPGASVWVHEPARAHMAERTAVTHGFAPGEPLPGGMVAHDAARGGEVVYWSEAHRALFAGDVLLGADGGAQLCPPSWTVSVTQEELVRTLQGLLDLPAELLCLAHGGVVDDGSVALARALAA